MNPKVSVVITNFNRANTLIKSIESVLAQVTNFPIEIVVVDDGSTDGSVGILKNYYNNKRINVLHLMSHKGILCAYQEAFDRCSGEYIATCDSDDYWVDAYKLQKQVDYVTANPKCGICFTGVFNVKGRFIERSKPPVKMDYNKLLIGNFISEPSVMFINNSPKIKKCFALHLDAWDYELWLTLSRKYKIGFIPEYTAIYNIANFSSSNTILRYKRLKTITRIHLMKLWFVVTKGCSLRTFFAIWYVFGKSVLSIILKRWIWIR